MGTAIQALEREHAQLLERLAKVETAIAVLHDLQSPKLPLAPPVPAATRREPRAQSPEPTRPARPGPPAAGAAELLPAAVRVALKDGPLPVGELLRKSGTTRYFLRQYLARGLVVADGATLNRRVALPGPRPAKEAP